MLLLPPALSQLLEAAHNLASGEPAAPAVQAALPAARSFVTGGARLLEQLSPGILRTPRVQELLETGRRGVDEQQRALLQLDQAAEGNSAAGAARAAEALRASTLRLQDALRDLQAEEREAQLFSPYPELDMLLKVARNVLDLHVPPPVLAGYWRPAAARVTRLRLAADRFRELHERTEPQDPLERLEAGLGATAEFLQAGRRLPLEDALRLIGPASVELHEALRECEATVAQKTRPAREPLVADLMQASPELAERIRTEIAALMDEEEVRVEALRTHPLRALANLQPPTAALERARAAKAPADLDQALADLRHALHAQEERLDAACKPVQGAPLLVDLQVLVGRALLGELSMADLHTELDHFRALQSELSAEMRRSVGLMDPGDEDELQGLLMRQTTGTERLAAFLADGDSRHLLEGWAVIADSAPRLIELSEGLRSRLQPEAPTGSMCVRCGAANPREARYCQKCSAVLPVMAQAPTEYADITQGAEGPAPVPAHVARLETLVQRVESGEAGPDEVAAEVDDLLARAERVAQSFEGQVGRAADPTVREYAVFFQEQMQLYFEGLQTMRQFAEDGHPDHLYRGLDACRQAGLELMAMRSVIEGALAR